jgi:hypothetical protein
MSEHPQIAMFRAHADAAVERAERLCARYRAEAAGAGATPSSARNRLAKLRVLECHLDQLRDTRAKRLASGRA